MYQKGNIYLADWRDRKGVRHRKSFDNPEAARVFEDVQRAAHRPKKKGPVQLSGKRSPRSSPATSPVQRKAGPRGTSSRSLAASIPQPYGSNTSHDSISSSRRARTHSPGKFEQLPPVASSGTSKPTTAHHVSRSASRKHRKHDPATLPPRRKKKP